MHKKPIRIAITGAAGQIGYALAFRVASGDLFGPAQPVELHLIELPVAMPALEGVVMELEDCAFPLLTRCVATSDLDVGFKDVQWALLVGSVPRRASMERKDLLQINAQVFVEQGRALQAHAAHDIQILVVGNPCNTNAWIAKSVAPEIPPNRFLAMTRLDENRAKAQLAKKASVEVQAVTRMTIWGNHSATQYPDIHLARISGQPLQDVISDTHWLESNFIETVQQRGAAVLQARGASSAASAAHAVLTSVQSVTQNTGPHDWHSIAVVSSGQYGVPEGLVSSFPVRCEGAHWNVVEGLDIHAFSKAKIEATVAELLEEQQAVKGVLDT